MRGASPIGVIRGGSRSRRSPFLIRYGDQLHIALRQWPGMLGIAVITLGTSLLSALQPLPVKVLVDNGLSGAPPTGFVESMFESADVEPTSRNIVLFAAVAAFAITLVLAALTAVTALLWERVGQRMVRDLTLTLHARLLRMSRRFHAASATGDMLSRLNYDAQSIYAAVSGVLISPWINCVTIVVVGASAWRISRSLTVVIFVAAPALAAMSWYFGPRLRERSRSAHDARSDVASFVTQVMHAMPVVQAFTTERQNLTTFRALSADAVATVRRSAIVTSVAEGFGQLLAVLGTALVLVVGGTAVTKGKLTLGALLVFIAYAKTLEVQWNGLLLTHRSLRSAEGGMDRVQEILDAKNEISEPAHPQSFPATTGGSRIALDGVSFGYQPERPVLVGVDLRIDAGETVALVGRTGAGKTTLTSLISRFIEPWSGRVLIDGIDVRDVPLSSVRARVAIVGQNPLLLPISIAENIAYGYPTGWVTRREIESAAEEAFAAEFVERLPDGYDTIVGERGFTLSGGQRQRLAIARAFLKDSPILVLDEPTSALDAESESLVIAAVERLSTRRTVVVIAHRLSTVRRADRIVVLDAGRIVEQGTHEELLRAVGPYASFYRPDVVGSDA